MDAVSKFWIIAGTIVACSLVMSWVCSYLFHGDSYARKCRTREGGGYWYEMSEADKRKRVWVCLGYAIVEFPLWCVFWSLMFLGTLVNAYEAVLVSGRSIF